ncbi:MAG: roadblock/LC7 domain-containing protein [Candidatus Ranarchaeia archaeon]
MSHVGVQPSTSMTEKIEDILKKVSGGISSIEGMTLTTWGGITIASITSTEIDDVKMGAVASGLQGMSKMALGLFDIGKMQTITLRGSDGFLMITDVGNLGILTVTTAKEAQLGNLIFSLNEASKKIRELMPQEIIKEIEVPDWINEYLGFDVKKIDFKKVVENL